MPGLLPNSRFLAVVPSLLLVSALHASGCVPPEGDLGEYTETEASTGTGTTGAPPTGTETTGTATTGEPTTGSDPGSGLQCGEVERPESFSFVFEPALEGFGFTGDCVVADDQGGYVFECGEQQVTLTLTLDHDPQPLLQVGDAVQLSAADGSSVPFSGVGANFSIRRADDQSLLIAGITAFDLESDSVAGLFAPVALEAVEGLCPAPISCNEPWENIGVRATHEQQTVELMAGGIAQLGEQVRYDVSLEDAKKFYHEVDMGQGKTCQVLDLPGYYFDLMIRVVPGE